MSAQQKITVTGTLQYIDEYKRLHFQVSEPEHQAKLEELNQSIVGKSPIYKKDDEDFTRLRVNLSKYEKVNMDKYEKVQKKTLTITLKVTPYDSEAYGKGTSLTLHKYRVAQTD